MMMSSHQVRRQTRMCLPKDGAIEHSDGLDDTDDDELDRYLQLRVAPDPASPNPIRWWLNHAAAFPNLTRMALNYLIIPGAYCSISMTRIN
jgi:hypothetical protein